MDGYFSDPRIQVIANGIMNDVGLDTVQMFAKLDDGSQEIFTYYAEVENVERVDRSEMPQYLEDNVECFDPSQCIVTKEQLDKQHNSSSWFSLSTLKFWQFSLFSNSVYLYSKILCNEMTVTKLGDYPTLEMYNFDHFL